MNRLFVVALASALAGAASARAADRQVSTNDLSKLGLGSLSVISDDQGLDVRGKAGAVASSGTAVTLGQFATIFAVSNSNNNSMSSTTDGGNELGSEHIQGAGIIAGLSFGGGVFDGALIAGAGAAIRPGAGAGTARSQF